jgi:hypothetical protein
VQVGHPPGELVEGRVVDLLARIRDGFAGLLHELFRGDLVAGHPDDRAIEQPASLQLVQGAEGHLAGEVSGDAEDDQHVRGGVAVHQASVFRSGFPLPQQTTTSTADWLSSAVLLNPHMLRPGPACSGRPGPIGERARSRAQPVISTLRGLAASDFGTVTVRTPSESRAVTASALTSPGR